MSLLGLLLLSHTKLTLGLLLDPLPVDAIRIVYNMAVVTFDEVKAIIGGAKSSTVIAVMAVSSVIVRWEWCVWCVIAEVDVLAADTDGAISNGTMQLSLSLLKSLCTCIGFFSRMVSY